MKNIANKKIVLSVITISLVLLIILNTTLPKFENLTLEEIKDRIKETKKKYICEYRDALTVACPKDEILKTIDNEEEIKKFVDITISLDEKNSNIIAGIGNENIIYFIDKNDKVIISAEGLNSYYLRTKNKKYEMDLSRIEELRELVGYPNGN
ncbi:MAG: hypothetical protein OSJ70_03325 [Bacilli bacterium]|nr:hypothetical protein [Bacilli bacterium]